MLLAERDRLSAERDAARDEIEPLQTAPVADAATHITLPPPDCTTEDGTDGYRFPGPGCMPVTARWLGAFSGDQQLSADFSDADLRKVAGTPDLRVLILEDTQVSDLTPLSPLSALERLFLKGTQVSDLRPLLGLANLRRVVLPTGQQIGGWEDIDENRREVQNWLDANVR